MTFKLSTLALVAGTLLISVSSANASLVYDSSRNNNGQGFGAVNNILTFASTGGATNGSSVAGGVGWDGAANTFFGVAPDGAVDTNVIKTNTWTFGSLGLSQASDITVFWNPAEQGSTAGQNSQVDLAVLNIYTDAGAVFWSSGQSTTTDSGFTAAFFAGTINNGVGGDGYGFGLDAGQALSLQTALGGVGNFSNYRIGLYAEHSLLDNGPDTWTIGKGPGTQVPEPSSLALLGAGLLGFVAIRRRRR